MDLGGAAALAIPAALGVGLWFGGGPTTRDGWEAASWAADITAAVWLVVTAVAWAASPRSSDGSRSDTAATGGVHNTVTGGVHGNAQVAQGRDVHLE